MPSLQAIFTADASGFRKELQAADKLAQTVGKRMQQSLSATALHLEQQVVAAKKAGVSYAGYEAELLIVRTQLAKVNAELAEQVVIQNASTTATKNALFPGAQWRTVMRETLIVMREIGRGNWSRVPGSLSIIVQSLGSGLLKFLPMLSRLAIGAVIVNNLNRAFKNLAEGAEDALNRTANATNRFHAIANGLRAAADRARDFKEWLDKLHEPHETLSDKTQERIRLMREEFNLQQQIASKQGKTPRERAQAELEQDRKELAVLKKAQSEAEAKAREAEQKAVEVQSQFPQRRANDLSVFEADADKQADILAKVISKDSGTTVTGGKLSAAFKSNTLPQLLSAFKGRGDRLIEYEDGKYTTLNQAKAGFESAAKLAATTAETVRDAEDKIKTAREKAEKAARDKSDLEKAASDKAASIAMREKYLPEVAALTGRAQVVRGSVNSLQQIGAYAAAGQIALIDVNKQIHHEIKGLRNDIKTGATAHTSRKLGGVKYG